MGSFATQPYNTSSAIHSSKLSYTSWTFLRSASPISELFLLLSGKYKTSKANVKHSSQLLFCLEKECFCKTVLPNRMHWGQWASSDMAGSPRECSPLGLPKSQGIALQTPLLISNQFTGSIYLQATQTSKPSIGWIFYLWLLTTSAQRTWGTHYHQPKRRFFTLSIHVTLSYYLYLCQAFTSFSLFVCCVRAKRLLWEHLV